MDQTWYVAAVWIGLALIASVISMRTAISVALVEICVGVIGGNFLGLDSQNGMDKLFWRASARFFSRSWLELKLSPRSFAEYGKESISIGFFSFLLPFLGAWAYAYYIAQWTLDAALICGIALSTTSVAVVYAVMVETGLNKSELGKLILAACFRH